MTVSDRRSATEHLGDKERQLQALLRVETRVAGGLVPVGEVEVRPAPADAVDDHCGEVVDRDARRLRQVVEDKAVLPDGDRPQKRPVRKDKADLEERRRVARRKISASVMTMKMFGSLQKSRMKS